MWRIESYKPDRISKDSSIGVDKRAYKMVVYNDDCSIKVPLYVYLGADMSSCRKVIFSIHGVYRDARKYRNIFVDPVQNQNVLIVSPRFTDPFYENPLSLTIGGVRQKLSDKSSVLMSDWTFTHLYQIFKLLQKEFQSINEMMVFGHSAGAQFAHRMLLMNDYPELSKVVAANPGWLTILDESAKFPYGLKNIMSSFDVEAVLSKRLILMAGTEDVYNDDNLRMTRKAMLQGENRLERTLNAYKHAKKIADDNNYEFNWKFVPVEGVGHDSRRMAPEALRQLLG